MTSVPGPEPEPLPGSPEPSGEEHRRVLCRMCGRPLRGRRARLWGLGDDCREKLALRSAPAPGTWEIAQDELPWPAVPAGPPEPSPGEAPPAGRTGERDGAAGSTGAG
ncbi:DUF6011 domain-containing protein [Streptomyces sp. TRM 70361]|uniref:DUF6011 domain-containing protein n=1 Tax=Streptomyces sp. TRM 70361 TaxID=3116553 RepID=UPI002E7C1978|nr:DUF6011 domain-containing protein [Streptomyces sp. TRM 70361]MEE1939963.1 DUF6011 domain-containing protein [Streptomyces sp. TRM 70361]